MNMKKTYTAIITSALLLACTVPAFAQEVPDMETIASRAYEFASQYPYKEGDTEKTFELYPNVVYASGYETRSDGVVYECPALYYDQHAMLVDSFDLEKGDMGLSINGNNSDYGQECVLYNSVTLVPVSVFGSLGCDIWYDDAEYVATVKKGDTTLEIVPYLIGMRKNQASGYYVPLQACARYVDGILYVPLRAVAEEFDLNVGWDGDTHTVVINSY